MLREILGDEDVYLVLRSSTRIDVGGWLGGGRVCIAVTAGAAFLLARRGLLQTHLPNRLCPPDGPAAGGGCYVQRIPLTELLESTYNHVVGELLLAPAAGARVRKLKLPPLDAYRLLAQIHHGNRKRVTEHA